MATVAANPVLIDRLWFEDHPKAKMIRAVVLVVVGSLLMTLAAKVKIPLQPVPITMQLFVVLTLGAAYGSRLGAAAIVFYLMQGAVGLPVFTDTPEKGIGLAYMMGGTGGYLIGFACAAYIVGWLAERGWDRDLFLSGATMLIGIALIYIPGVIWLGVLFGWDKPILEWGFYPFIAIDLIKGALAMAVLPLAWKLLDPAR